MMHTNRNLARILTIAVFVISVFGLIVLASASVVLSQERYNESFYFVRHQLMYGFAVGVVAYIVGMKLSLEWLKRIAPILLGAAIILLALVLLPGLGYTYGGANRWITIGPFSLQPSEPAKLAILVYLAAWLSQHQKELHRLRDGFMPFTVIVAVIGFLILLQPDIGTLFVITAASTLVFFFAGGRITHLALFGVVALLVIGSYVALDEHRIQRVTTFLTPTADVQDSGYQVRQSLIAIGAGGIGGKGYGDSQQKYSYLPEPMGDSIYAIMAEELGFVGATLLIVVYLGIGYIGYQIIRHTTDTFSRLMAFGIVALLLIQAFVNIGVVTASIPFTGITLPFISYGSSSLITFLAAAGLLTNVARKIES